MNIPFFNLINGAINKVREMNRANPNVETADASVFDNVVKRFDKSKEKPHVNTEEEYCEDICEEINQVQVENEADPNIATADKSVFDEMKAEIEALKAQVRTQKTEPTSAPTNTPSAPHAKPGEVMAMTNSIGGSLALRTNPDFAAAAHPNRIPDNTLVKVLQYSEKSIRLDGKDTRFVLVQVGEEQGWLLESYLNFN